MKRKKAYLFSIIIAALTLSACSDPYANETYYNLRITNIQQIGNNSVNISYSISSHSFTIDRYGICYSNLNEPTPYSGWTIEINNGRYEGTVKINDLDTYSTYYFRVFAMDKIGGIVYSEVKEIYMQKLW